MKHNVNFFWYKSIENANISIVEVKYYVYTLVFKINSQNINRFMVTTEIELLNNLKDKSVLSRNTYNNY